MIVKLYTSAAEKAEKLFHMQDFVLLWLRLWVAEIFYDSGRTKAGTNYWEVNDFQATLFEEEYGITFVDPAVMAQLALYMETLLPILLMLGLGSRFAALGLLAMTVFIQFFVYPLQFTDHMLWAVALLAVIFKGAGVISIDNMIARWHSPKG